MKGRLNLGMAALGMGLALAAAVPVRAGSGGLDDDLAVVKKAVQSEATLSPPEAPSEDRAPQGARPSRGSGQWLKVRIVEGHGKRTRITVNVPLAVARTLGGDLPLDLGDQKIRLSDVLNQLEAGEPLVEVKKKDAIVRVWIE